MQKVLYHFRDFTRSICACPKISFSRDRIVNQLYMRYSRQFLPLTNDGIPFLMFCWAHQDSPKLSSPPLMAAIAPMIATASADPFNTTLRALLDRYSSHEGYALHLAQALSRALRDERSHEYIGSNDTAIVAMMSEGLFANGMILYPRLPEGTEIIPSIIIYCNRQICTGSRDIRTVSTVAKCIHQIL